MTVSLSKELFNQAIQAQVALGKPQEEAEDEINNGLDEIRNAEQREADNNIAEKQQLFLEALTR